MVEKNQPKSKGGKRSGAGRPKGTATKKTREIADKAAAEGITPLEVMLHAMRYSFGEFEKTLVVDHLVAASSFAKDAAPYMHPRLTTIAGDPKAPLGLTVSLMPQDASL